MELIKILTPFGAFGLNNSVLREDFGMISCIEYTQKGTPVDRGWPSVYAGILLSYFKE